MTNINDELKYTKEHEWVRIEDEFTAVCGLTDHAQDMLISIVFVELPDLGREVRKGDQVAVVESAKAITDILAPLTGTIIDINFELEDNPELINSDPYGQGWMFTIDIQMPNEVDDLMNADEYQAHVDSGD